MKCGYLYTKPAAISSDTDSVHDNSDEEDEEDDEESSSSEDDVCKP